MNKTIKSIEIINSMAKIEYNDQEIETINLVQPTKLLYVRAKEQINNINKTEEKIMKAARLSVFIFVLLATIALLTANFQILADGIVYSLVALMSLTGVATVIIGDNLHEIRKKRKSLSTNVEKITNQLEKIKIRKISNNFFAKTDLTFEPNSIQNLDFSSQLLTELSDRIIEEIQRYKYNIIEEEPEKDKVLQKKLTR